MIIKSHIRGGFTSAAAYLSAIGTNERMRLVEFNDHGARNLNEAFSNMWAVADTTRASKPLHHVSINPHKDERLDDAQVQRICAQLEEKYGYAPGEHQRVIVEHVKDGRQHFHVMWNRVSLSTGRPVWPGHHWNKSKQVAREMEAELGLIGPVARRVSRATAKTAARLAGRDRAPAIARVTAKTWARHTGARSLTSNSPTEPRSNPFQVPATPIIRRARVTSDEVPAPRRPAPMYRRRSTVTAQYPTGTAGAGNADDWARRAVIAWAWKNGRWDVLALYGIYVPFDL